MTDFPKNWAGSVVFHAPEIHHPASLEELRRMVTKAPRVHAIGSRHCFNDIADSAVLLSLDQMPMPFEIDREAGTITVNPGMRYVELAAELERAGLALHAMASLPQITVGGAIATATHGSGDRTKNLAGAVAAMELVTSDGEIVQAARGDAEFDGMVVHLGALGVLTRVTLDIEPSYRVRQEVFLDLPWETLFEQFDAITGCAESVSLFTDYGETVSELWCKSRVGVDDRWTGRAELFGARAARVRMHPVPSFDSTVCTEQLGLPGPWSERLPHFVANAIGDRGNELQSEYMVARPHAVAALRVLHGLSGLIHPRVLTGEIRTAAADDLWLSSSYGVDTVCLHFTWKFDPAVVTDVLPVIERALEPFAPRPHWGKVFVATAVELAPRYPRMGDFRALAARLDPRGAFRNDFLDRTVFG